jgi:hypothetical protein
MILCPKLNDVLVKPIYRAYCVTGLRMYAGRVFIDIIYFFGSARE